MKRAKRNVWYAMAGIFIFLGLSAPVRATEVTMTLQQTTRDVEIKEKPDQNSNIVSELPAGTGVIVYGESKDSWSQIEYAGVSGYIESSALKPYIVGSVEELEQEFEGVQEDTLQAVDEQEMDQQSEQASAIDEESDSTTTLQQTTKDTEIKVDVSTEELEQEFEEVQEETLRMIEEYEMVQKSKRTSMIWGIVIAVLVVAIFAVGVVSAIKKDKEEETEKVEEEKEEET